MKTPDIENFSDDDFYSEDLADNLPRRLELLTLGHRNFSIRAAQELYRAERYRQYLSLVIIRGSLADSSGTHPDLAASLNDLAKLVRGDCRTSDLVSGVENGTFAVLLVETEPEGAAKFLARLAKSMALFSADRQNPSGEMPFPVEVVTFPDQGDNALSLNESLDYLYRRSNVRP